MLSVPIPIFFSAMHLISWSQIPNPLSSDHLPLLSSHYPLMVTLTLVFLRKCITSKICFLNPTQPTIFFLVCLLSHSHCHLSIPKPITFSPSSPSSFLFLFSTHLSLILYCTSIINALKMLPTPLYPPSTGLT